ncbi:MAG: DUF4097 domain-containing protein [Candidatus Aminicenantes bacterium]|nr:DUF4097 domain-containing protein [Candidatus Aminicenantes bacterium]
MKKTIFVLLSLIVGIAIGLFAATEYKVEESEDIQKTLRFQDSSKLKEVIVDNIFGYIHVEGTSSKDVQLRVRKTIKARTADRLKIAKEEVALDINEDGNTIDLYVNGPFRLTEEERENHERRNPGYAVHYDFTLLVPHQTSLTLKTVTEGDITVKNIEGNFEINNVNGQIEMTDVSGSGDAHTVNGKVEVSFTKNPNSNCSFKTINGDVKLNFQPDLSASFWLKTFTGDAFSDFPVSYLPSKPAEETRKDGKFVYKSSNTTGLRIGKGGPEIKMNTMNGDLLIEKFK